MTHESCHNTADTLHCENSRFMPLWLHIVRSVVERHGGIVGKDLVTNKTVIYVPENEAVLCSQEIDKRVGSLYNHIYTHIAALLGGKSLSQIINN